MNGKDVCASPEYIVYTHHRLRFLGSAVVNDGCLGNYPYIATMSRQKAVRACHGLTFGENCRSNHKKH